MALALVLLLSGRAVLEEILLSGHLLLLALERHSRHRKLEVAVAEVMVEDRCQITHRFYTYSKEIANRGMDFLEYGKRQPIFPVARVVEVILVARKLENLAVRQVDTWQLLAG